MPRSDTVFVCSACGHESARWAGRCRTAPSGTRLSSSAAPRRGGPAARFSRRGAAGGARARRRPVTPVALREVEAIDHERLEHRDRRARLGARRRGRARLAGADRRRARDRQVDAHDDGGREPLRGRAAHAVRVGRGVRGPDSPACAAARRRRGARGARDRRDRPRRRARHARAGAAQGVRDRLRADAALVAAELGARARSRRCARRPRRSARSPSGSRPRCCSSATSPRRARSPVPACSSTSSTACCSSRVSATDVPDRPRDQEPVRLHQRGRRVRDAR